jgi:MFS family permease
MVAAGLAVIAVADTVLIPSARSSWAVALCPAGAGAGIGLSSVAATGLGTDVGPRWRGGASGLVNTTAQLGTAVGVAVLLLIATVTSGMPAASTSPPDVARAVGAAAAAAGAARFTMAARNRTGQLPSSRDMHGMILENAEGRHAASPGRGIGRR